MMSVNIEGPLTLIYINDRSLLQKRPVKETIFYKRDLLFYPIHLEGRKYEGPLNNALKAAIDACTTPTIKYHKTRTCVL